MTTVGEPVAGSSRWRRAFSLRAALSALVVSTVACTALILHLSWSWTAEENVADVVGQLNTQIAGSVRREVQGLVSSTLALQEAVRSIFAEGALMAEEPEKRAVLFLSLLRSQPGLSWVSLGLPDGSFVGAQKQGESGLDLVEVDRRSTPMLDVSHYTQTVDGARLQAHAMQPSDYDARSEDWFRRAVEARGPVWVQLPHLPNSERNAITTSTPLFVGSGLAGVVNVAIEVDRLSRFLSGVKIGRMGMAAILDPSGYVVASPDAETIRLQEGNMTPSIEELARRDPMFRVAANYLERSGLAVSDIARPMQMKVRADKDGADYFIAITPLDFQGWVLATVIPADEFLARIDRNSRILLIVLGALTLVIGVTATVAAHRLVGLPLLRISSQLRHIESFELERIQPIASPLRELDDFSSALMQMAGGLASFRKYVPADLVRTLVAQGIEAKPGGTRQLLTVMFTDLAGFTSLSERLREGVVPVLSRYLEETTGAITAHRGTIDKFIGDAVMALWGAPMADPDHAADACAAALEACRRLAASGTGLRMRIGINTGVVLVGNIGSSDRLSYTAIGDSVNVASRLEAVNKRYGTEILIGEETRKAAGAAILVRRLDWISVYGRAGGTIIYELLGMAGDDLPDWVRLYEAGLDGYEDRRWAEAIQLFEAAIEARGADQPSEIMISRCRELLAHAPGPDWRPLVALESK
ncbi:MAG: adenylate/guanylate cyclase domain-containing protein [Proteobacteria bacterium]|nr:adenylate/guanylate cyclase domain-containing protein [Pseudomonadota bacterium]